MTANIRELLESAARALGLEYVEYTSYDEIDDVYSTCCWVRAAEGKLISWNPAEDDGDCARMEAALAPMYARLEKQRDELLKALDAMVAAFAYRDGSELYRAAALLKAQEVIASVKGK